jgi:hypothetical protein
VSTLITLQAEVDDDLDVPAVGDVFDVANDRHDFLDVQVVSVNRPTASQPYEWCKAILEDARDSDDESVPHDVPDAVIEREAYKLEALCFQLAGSFVSNEFTEAEDQ